MKNIINIFDFSMLGTKDEFNRHEEIKGKKLADVEIELGNEDKYQNVSADNEDYFTREK